MIIAINGIYEENVDISGTEEKVSGREFWVTEKMMFFYQKHRSEARKHL